MGCCLGEAHLVGAPAWSPYRRQAPQAPLPEQALEWLLARRRPRARQLAQPQALSVKDAGQALALKSQAPPRQAQRFQREPLPS